MVKQQRDKHAVEIQAMKGHAGQTAGGQAGSGKIGDDQTGRQRAGNL